MGLENAKANKSQMSAFITSRAKGIKAKEMLDMSTVISTCVKESEEKGISMKDALANLLGKNQEKNTQNKDDKGMEI